MTRLSKTNLLMYIKVESNWKMYRDVTKYLLQIAKCKIR